VDEGIEWALSTPDARLTISISPQQGKSTRCAVWAPIRALQLDPDRRILIASCAESRAGQHARTARNVLAQSGSAAQDPLTGAPLPDRLGLELASDKSAASHWTVKGHRGGVYATGVGGGLSGRPAELAIIDDPYKNMEEVDSATHRAKVEEWFNSVLTTRLAPGSPLILIRPGGRNPTWPGCCGSGMTVTRGGTSTFPRSPSRGWRTRWEGSRESTWSLHAAPRPATGNASAPP